MIWIVSTLTFFAAVITFLTGFGLSTILVPVFSLFFPIPLAIASVALVHFINNLFKLILVGRWANRAIVWRFGIPALFTALLGGLLMVSVSHLDPLYTGSFLSIPLRITAIGAIVGILVMLSSLFEWIPKLSHFSFSPKYLTAGGALSGFLGGLTGHQGLLRSAFLVKAGMGSKEYVGTSSACSVLVDFSRLAVYGLAFLKEPLSGDFLISTPVLAACAASLIGSLVGLFAIKKMEMAFLQRLVSFFLFFLGLALALGIGINSPAHSKK